MESFVVAISLDNKSRTAGAANPALTYTVTGFANGDTQSVLTGAPVLATTADASATEETSYPRTYLPIAALNTW